MMKLLLENWKAYTQSLLNEELLIESYEEAKQSVITRSSKWFKGYIYQHDLDLYNMIEERIKNEVENTWGKDYNKQSIAEIKNSGYVFGWDVAGYFICFVLSKSFIPTDITDRQRQLALLWSYRQFIADQNGVLDSSEKDEFVFSLLAMLLTKAKGSRSVSRLADWYGGDLADPIYDYYYRYFGGLHDVITNIIVESGDDAERISRESLIERFFQMNRFIRDGKRDLNAVVDFNELYELVEEARPLYQAWQEKQEEADAEGGKEVLLNDNNWEVIVIHNKGAACQLGKGTDWCTAAPGLEYFKHYYKPNDPLFYIFDKSINEKFQFHFGSHQFMDKYDRNVYPSRAHLGDEIMGVLAQVVPSKYDIAYRWLANYR